MNDWIDTCVKTFHSKVALTQHVAVGTHLFTPTTESKRLNGMDERIVGAWAVMCTKRKKRFSADVEQFGLLEFLIAALFTAVLKAAPFNAVLI